MKHKMPLMEANKKNPKNIWIVNEHLTTPELSNNGHSRHYSLGMEFMDKGYGVSLITSSFSHNPRRNVKIKGLLKIMEGNVKTLIIRGISYKNPSSKLRIVNWIFFSLLFFFAPFTRLPKPDIIILSSTPMLPVYGILFFKLFNPKCKFIFETRDLWPLTPLSIGNYSKNSIFIKVLSHLEYLCYSRADYIVSVLKNSDKHVLQVLRGRQFRFKWISNGIDLHFFEKNQDTKKWEFLSKINREESFIVGYAGTIGNANAMEFIVQAFNENFKDTNFYLLILGEGGDKEALELIANGNPNVFFLNTVPKNVLPSFYQVCDILYLSARNRKLYEYGLSANKIFEYMYSKKPILLSGNFSDNLIDIAQCGFVIESEDSDEIGKKIIAIKEMPKEDKDVLGENGYSYLMNNLTYSKLADDYIKVFEELFASKNNSK